MKGIARRLLVATVLLGLLGTGCNSWPWPFRDWNYQLGAAYRENADKMIANPEAVDAEAKPVVGFDGQSGEDVMTRYRREQTAPPRAPAPSIINIGTGSR